ncbi:MAG TPA: alpha/beta hydrolase [Verrucomicrobiae bacterium]|nr:alpha/beta hydrolase [Verrucomicrobiae bacterium]
MRGLAHRRWRPGMLIALMAIPTLACVAMPQTNAPPAIAAKDPSADVEAFLSDATTPTSFPGAQTFVYRELKPDPLLLFVVKPDGWQPSDHRPAMVYFFGGAWTRGNPTKSIGWARMAAKWGMVGIAPDYRTRERFNTTPVESVADARAAIRWVDDHAAELGVNASKVVVAGASAGGHLALWTAITAAPFGSRADESPTTKPVALVLISAPADTSDAAWNNDASFIKRFGPHITDVSPLQNLDSKMPPVLMFHGNADPTVPYSIAAALHDKLIATSNTCEFVTISGGGHGLPPSWKETSRQMIKDFLTTQRVLPATGR